MAITAGNYSCADHPEVIIRQNQMWLDPRTNRQFNYNLNTLKCVLDKQKVSFPEQLLDNSCDTVKVTFLAACESPIDDCCVPGDPVGGGTWDCEIPAAPKRSGADCVEFNWNWCKTAGITVMDDECKGEFALEEKLAYETNLAKIQLAKALQDMIISSLNANTTLPTHDGIGEPNAGLTAIEIPAALASADIMWDIQNYAEQENLMDYCILTGQMMAKQIYNANKSTCCNNGVNKFNDVEWCINSKDFDQVIGNKSLLLWDKGSTAFFNTFQYDNMAPMNRGDEYNTRVWREPLMVSMMDADGNIVGMPLTYADGNTTRQVYVDIEEQRKCFKYDLPNGACESRMATRRRLRLRAGFIFAPSPCDDHTGIIKIECKA